MRRAFALGLLIAVAAAALLVGAGGKGADTYRVDAIFDNAAGLIPGQDVKIAGARVGAVQDITLNKQRKARVQMEIEPGFAPFRADADCIVRPQSIIGEKFVQCDPGHAERRSRSQRTAPAPDRPRRPDALAGRPRPRLLRAAEALQRALHDPHQRARHGPGRARRRTSTTRSSARTRRSSRPTAC